MKCNGKKKKKKKKIKKKKKKKKKKRALKISHRADFDVKNMM